MTELVPPNATPMERAFVQVSRELLGFATPLATLANPDTIPAAFLPWLAWSLGVRSWKPYWSEAVKRMRVRHAIAIARQQGTAQSVEDVVASFGGHVVVRPWFEQEPPGEPFTFQLTLTLTDSVEQDTSAAFVDTATKCFAIADSCPPSFSNIHVRAVCAFVIVSNVVKVFDETMNSVSSASRSCTASAKSVLSTFETNRNVISRLL